MRVRLACYLFIGLWPLSMAAQMPDHPITLREALELLRANNPALAAGRLHLQATAANEITARLRPNPVLSSANEDFNVFDMPKLDPVNGQEYTENISELIERGGKRRYRIQSARLGTTVAQQGYQDSQRQLEFQVKQAFVSMLLAKSNLELARQNLDDYKQVVELNKFRAQAGDISQTDFNRIRLQQARFESDLLAAQLALEQARTQLELLLGFRQLLPSFDIAGSLTNPELSLDLQQLQNIALQNRPDYLGAKAASQKAAADLNLAQAGGATDVTVGTEYKRNGPANTLGVTFSVPLRIFDRNQGEKLRTSREFEASKANETAARNQVLSDVSQAYTAYKDALSLAQIYSRDYLQQARDVRDRIEFSYRNGGASLLEFLDAVRDYRDIYLASAAASAQVLNAAHQLSFATATELLP